MHKMEAHQHDLTTNIGSMSKAIKELRASNKDFVSKQHMVTERLVGDLHKQSVTQSQQTSFLKKEVSDIRDAMQLLASNLQKNFNECIQAAIQQCSDLNVQNSNSIQSLRKMSDQKVGHLQQLLVDSQKRAQSQNASILDIINSNQKNQSEFQNSFKVFFEKFRDSMHQNLSALQESSQEQISYLDNVLRAEVKSRMKQQQSTIKETDAKLFVLEEQLQQFERDSKRSWDFVTKSLDAVRESQQHQSTANQPMHKMISNLTTQLDSVKESQLTDVKSIMMLNQDTSEKQFDQIKSLQIQLQQLWTKVSQQERQHGDVLSSPNGPHFQSPSHHAADNQYLVRPQSYKSDMSSTAAFNAIKHHLDNMPGRPTPSEQAVDREFNSYIDEVTPVPTQRDAGSTVMASDSHFVEASPRPIRAERMPLEEQEEEQEQEPEEETMNPPEEAHETPITVTSFTPNDDLVSKPEDIKVPEQGDEEYDEPEAERESVDDDKADEAAPTPEATEAVHDDGALNMGHMAPSEELMDEQQAERLRNVEVDGDEIDDILGDEAQEADAVDAVESEKQSVPETESKKDSVVEVGDERADDVAADPESAAVDAEDEEYDDEEYEDGNAEEEEEEEIELTDTEEHQTGDLEDQERALAMLEQEQSALSEQKEEGQDENEEVDDYDSDF